MKKNSNNNKTVVIIKKDLGPKDSQIGRTSTSELKALMP